MTRARRFGWVLGLGVVVCACSRDSAPQSQSQSQSQSQVEGEQAADDEAQRRDLGEQAGPTATTGEPPSPLPEGSEVAFLDANPGSAEDRVEPERLAKACDRGDHASCRKLANHYEEGIGTPLAPERAIAIYERGCDAGLAFHCALAGLTRRRDPDGDREHVTLLFERACEGDHLHGCALAASEMRGDGSDPANDERAAELLAKGCAGGYAGACAPGVEYASDPVRDPTPEAVCPEAFHWTTGQSGGPRLHGQFGVLDHERLLAALPGPPNGFEEESRSSTPAGRAGTRTSSARVGYRSGERSVWLSILDNAPNCTLQPGTGAAMISTAADNDDTRAIAVDGADGALLTTAPSAMAALWFGDRCTVSVTGVEATKADVLAVVDALDGPAIRELCLERPKPGVLSGL